MFSVKAGVTICDPCFQPSNFRHSTKNHQPLQPRPFPSTHHREHISSSGFKGSTHSFGLRWTSGTFLCKLFTSQQVMGANSERQRNHLAIKLSNLVLFGGGGGSHIGSTIQWQTLKSVSYSDMSAGSCFVDWSSCFQVNGCFQSIPVCESLTEVTCGLLSPHHFSCNWISLRPAAVLY